MRRGHHSVARSVQNIRRKSRALVPDRDSRDMIRSVDLEGVEDPLLLLSVDGRVVADIGAEPNRHVDLDKQSLSKGGNLGAELRRERKLPLCLE